MYRSADDDFDNNLSIGLKDRGVMHLKISEAQKVYEVYEFKQELGHGSFGVVMAAIEKANKKAWAVKIVHKNIAGANKLVEVDREIKILKCVDHPNIVHLERVYESPKKIYMILEMCETELLQTFLKEKPFSEKATKRVMLQLADSVSYLHKNEIVHRDIKMENILLAKNPNDPKDRYFIKLTDFGLSIVKSGVGIRSLMTDYCGTIAYMAPEILQMKTYSELCDVWAMGIIMFMLLYGTNPFMARTDEQITEKICNEEPKYDTDGINPEAIELLKSILKKNPVQRVTAGQIKENSWLNNRRRKGNHKLRNDNIIDMMKQFRNDTETSVSRGLSINDGAWLPDFDM